MGQARTQFCELPQSLTPPMSLSASRRTALCILPEGCRLNRRTWLTAAGPMNGERSFTLGHASRQTPQDMHRDRA
ncbi:hypothetical protein D3C87_1453220 [compost metagenome]